MSVIKELLDSKNIQYKHVEETERGYYVTFEIETAYMKAQKFLPRITSHGPIRHQGWYIEGFKL